MKNIAACLTAAGSSVDKIVRRRIYTLDMAYLPQIQEVTKRYLEAPYPVSTAVQVSSTSIFESFEWLTGWSGMC